MFFKYLSYQGDKMNQGTRSIIRNTFYIQLTAFILLSLSSSVGSMIDGVVIGQFLGVDSIAASGTTA